MTLSRVLKSSICVAFISSSRPPKIVALSRGCPRNLRSFPLTLTQGSPPFPRSRCGMLISVAITDALCASLASTRSFTALSFDFLDSDCTISQVTFRHLVRSYGDFKKSRTFSFPRCPCGTCHERDKSAVHSAQYNSKRQPRKNTST